MNHDNYELPSIYKQKTEQYESIDQQQRADSFDLRVGPSLQQGLLPDNTTLERPLYQHENKDRQLAWLLLFAPLLVLIFTVVPATANLPNVDAMTSGDAIWRLIDPIFTLPPFLFIMFCADTTRYHTGSSTVIWLIWAIGAGIYVQGHGVHLSAALFKHPVQDFIEAHNQTIAAANPVLVEELESIYSYMRDLWEHDIGHYMYAAGAAIMSWAQMAAFCDQVHGPLTTGYKVLFCIASLVYGLLIGAIAIDFPAGCIVGLPYTIVLGTVSALLIVSQRRKDMKQGGLFTLGRRMVLQYYLGASIIGLIIIIGWVGKYGFANRSAAGI
ncbi:hypothetical protein BDA99DRAFT_507668 [Phascolomyces articulosus]|uniref:Uncharacterized protein n=1 Tax=Phascolomyces articulosus TaxID=60185 RepID=A0AAD5KB91_9FUNG|nr:hypothetical protein BDA99DRAFT_507668 [Phascolomyces articulosus]